MRDKYTEYGFVVSQHSYDKTGNTRNCSITLETNQTVLSENQVGIELEVLLMNKIIPHFGNVVARVHSVQFHWDMKLIDEKSVLVTSVTMTYTSVQSELSGELIEKILSKYQY